MAGMSAPSRGRAGRPSSGRPDAAVRRTAVTRLAWVALCVAAVVALFAAGAAWTRDDRVPAAEVVQPELPREARETLALIRAGGPFPYRRDGTVFGNRERLLPRQPRGYYTEYTVATPGSRDRGARRIVAGGDPRVSGEYWYTDDHYRSFRRIRE
jgi:ribonuclease T1